MNEAYWDRLIQGHLDDLLNEAEQAEFAARVRDSEAARRRFWELAEVHGLAREAARIAWPDADVEPNAVAITPKPIAVPFVPAPARLRPLGLVAAGLVLGILMSGLAWAIARPLAISQQALLLESFESNETPDPDGVPIVADRWSGDFVESVEAQSGVRPAHDRRMLRFLRSDFVGKPTTGGYISEIYRLIDVRNHRRDFVDDEAVVQVSAVFNAAPFAAEEQYMCSVAVFALDAATATNGTTKDPPQLVERALAVTRRSNDVLDRNPATWQKVSTELRLPPNTDYLMLRIAVGHGMPSRLSPDRETFSAHFADDVRVTLARRPLLP